jgi:hypothetical protein
MFLLLEATTLFYYDLSCRAYDKSSSGIIDNWFSKVETSVDGGKSGNGSTLSSTLVSTKVKGKLPPTKTRRLPTLEAIPVFKPVKRPTKSEPLRLITTSDEEWLTAPKQGMTAVSTS